MAQDRVGSRHDCGWFPAGIRAFFGFSSGIPSKGQASPNGGRRANISITSGFWEGLSMRRIGILTAGGDTPALNSTIFGAVERANDLGIEVVGFIRGFSGVIDPRMPHVR